ncbi:Uncharacterised protein [Yersinia pekkanenii]|uniref:Uncharacterized protein n=1 Tax=Yersinia pekkanenii TaxID=1288385 RepID=A0A0T9PEU1_9GAMM|nr:Uncharacterised protein [Yersinia pekkanenii]CRY66531.1 Uncharacterised protein [Yersinia pekkanenii]
MKYRRGGLNDSTQGWRGQKVSFIERKSKKNANQFY